MCRGRSEHYTFTQLAAASENPSSFHLVGGLAVGGGGAGSWLTVCPERNYTGRLTGGSESPAAFTSSVVSCPEQPVLLTENSTGILAIHFMPRGLLRNKSGLSLLQPRVFQLNALTGNLKAGRGSFLYYFSGLQLRPTPCFWWPSSYGSNWKK